MKMNIMKKATLLLKKTIKPSLILTIIALFVYIPLWFLSIYFSIKQSGYTLPILGSDSIEYFKLSKSIIENGCFSVDSCANPDFFRTIGYPIFISFFLYIFNSLFFITLIQIVLTILIGFFVYKILIFFNINENLSIYGMIFYILEPSVILHSLIILSDTLFVFLITLLFYLIIKYNNNLDIKNSLCFGLISGFSILVRPIAIFLLPLYFVFIYFVFKKEGYLNKIIFSFFVSFVAMILIITPWVIRNYLNTGKIIISSISSYNLFYYNVPMFLSYKNKIEENLIRENLIREAGISKKDLFSPVNLNILDGISLNYIKNNFFDYFSFHLYSTKSFFFGSSLKNFIYSINLIYKGDIDYISPNFSIKNIIINNMELLIFIERIMWMFFYVLILFGLFLNKRNIILLCLFFVLYFAVLTGPVSYVRYRLPAEPFIYIAFILSISSILLFIKERKNTNPSF